MVRRRGSYRRRRGSSFDQTCPKHAWVKERLFEERNWHGKQKYFLQFNILLEVKSMFYYTLRHKVVT